ncbi:aromatic acid exporter family protein [Phycicoccus avicenniae]|uniref:aromatic acid exporter family protein n=1 Tax=Phycicoccus avicenniae TaxID=2828860 RepID=UPI003D2CD9A0
MSTQVAPARRGVRATVEGWRATVRAVLQGPGPERDDALMLLKSAGAAVLAWQLAVVVVDSSTSFYAPLAALLVVDRTIVRSLWQSVERLVAVVVGMLVAWGVGNLVGVTWWSMVLVLLLALVIGRWDRLGAHGVQVPTMVLLSLLSLQWDSVSFTAATVLDTLLGGVVGVVVNAVVLAPMHLTAPRRAVLELTERLRGLLDDMAEGLRSGWDAEAARGWHDRATSVGVDVPAVLEAVETGRESTRLNLRHRLRPARVDWDGYVGAAHAVQRSQWPVAGIARTLADAAAEAPWQPSPSPEWLGSYAGVLEHLGAAAARFGVHREGADREVEEHLEAAGAALDALAEEVRSTPLDDPRAWPAYGTLIVEARRLVEEIRAGHAGASVPSDTGPLRAPLAEGIAGVAGARAQEVLRRREEGGPGSGPEA